MKLCGCGLAYTIEQFRALPFAYEQIVAGERHEARHCHCGSTIAIAWCVRCGARIPDNAPRCPICDPVSRAVASALDADLDADLRAIGVHRERHAIHDDSGSKT